MRGLSIPLRSRGFWNLSALYISLAVNGVISIALIAYLARTLGPEVWGLVLLTQAFGYWAAMIPEYGFTFSASRDIAQAEDPEGLSRVAYSVTFGKILLALAIIPVSLIAYFIVPGFNAHPIYLFAGGLFAIAQGFDPIWIFLGTERQYIYAILSTAARLVVLVLILWLVSDPEDGWKVMYFHTTGALLVLAGGMLYLWNGFPRTMVGLADVRKALQDGWKLFHYRGAQSLTANSSLVILGIVSPRGVEGFGSADRIMRNAHGLLGPISAAGMPRIARLVGSDVSAAQQTARLSLVVMMSVSCVVASLLIAFSPLVVHFLLGYRYEFVIPLLRIVSLALPFAAASTMLAVQWMLPLGLDRRLVRVTLMAGLFNVAGCLLFGWLYSATGAAIVMVAVEAFTAAALMLTIRRSNAVRFW